MPVQGHAKVAIGLVVLGVIAICVYRLALPWLDTQSQKSTTDSANIKATLRIGVDGWVGYFPLCSPEFKKRLRRSGYLLECIDDNADYKTRFNQLKSGKLDFAVATVDSYVLNGPEAQFPGPIVAVIDESKGGDAMVAWQESIPSLEAFRTLPNFKVAYTPASPSHHLLKAIASHFDVPKLREPAHASPSDGSTQAFAWFKQKQVQTAVLWEPELSQALALPGVIKLMSTADTKGLIVDVLIAGREQIRKNPEQVQLVLKTYFRTLAHYRNSPKDLQNAISKHYDVKSNQAQQLVKGVEWASLSDNVRYWFGIEKSAQQVAHQALVDTIESTVDVLIDTQDFNQSPLPQNDPFRLTNSAPLQAVWSNAAFSAQGSGSSSGAVFDALNEQAWSRLQPVGTLKIRPIVFASGSSEITQEGEEQVAKLVKDLKHYPNFRVEVRGHTGLRGDSEQNVKLSQARAQAVYASLVRNHKLHANRTRAIGLGASKPLPQMPGESYRAYNYRLPRVELVLLEEEL